MNKVKLILTLITVAITVIPIMGAVIAYRDNLPGLVVPSELTNLMNEGTGPIATNNTSLKPPTLVSNQADRTFSVSFQFTNPFPFDLKVNSMTSGVACKEHNFLLGNASLRDTVNMKAGETATLTLYGIWTTEAINHFQTAHSGQQNFDAELVDLNANLGGATVHIDKQDLGPLQVPR